MLKKGNQSKTKRGGRRVERHESFEDLFSGNAFDDDEEVSISSSQMGFDSPFVVAKQVEETFRTAPSFTASDSDMSMSGDETQLFASERGRHAKAHSDDDEYDAGSVDYDETDFDPFMSDEKAASKGSSDKDLDDSFDWKALAEDALKSALKSSFARKSILKKNKRSASLSEMLARSPKARTPAPSLASSHSGERSYHSSFSKPSSSTPPANEVDREFESSWNNFEAKNRRRKMKDTNTPEGVAGTYLMEPIRSPRSRSRSRAGSVSRGRGRSQSISRSSMRGRSEHRRKVSMFEASEAESTTEDDFFDESVFSDRSLVDFASPGTSSPYSPPSKNNITRILIRTESDRKINPAAAHRIIAEKMLEMKDDSESTSMASLGELHIVEQNGASANFSHTSLFLNDSCVEKLGICLLDGEKNREEGSTASNTESLSDSISSFESSKKVEHKEESPEDEKSEKKKHSRAKSPEKKSKARDHDKSQDKKGKERGRSKSPVKKSKSHGKESEKKEKKERGKTPSRRSKDHSSSSDDADKKERRNRSKSPTKKSKSHGESRSESPKKRSKQDESSRSSSKDDLIVEKSSSKKSKEERIRSKSRSRKDEASNEKSSSKRKKEEKTRSRKEDRGEEVKVRSKSRSRTDESSKKERIRSKSCSRKEHRGDSKSRSRKQ